jgi:hypothetical protein
VRQELSGSPISVMVSPMGFMQHKNQYNLLESGGFMFFVKPTVKAECPQGISAQYNLPSSYTTKIPRGLNMIEKAFRFHCYCFDCVTTGICILL